MLRMLAEIALLIIVVPFVFGCAMWLLYGAVLLPDFIAGICLEYLERRDRRTKKNAIFRHQCGKALPAAANFCPGCGAPVIPPSSWSPLNTMPAKSQATFRKRP